MQMYSSCPITITCQDALQPSRCQTAKKKVGRPHKQTNKDLVERAQCVLDDLHRLQELLLSDDERRRQANDVALRRLGQQSVLLQPQAHLVARPGAQRQWKRMDAKLTAALGQQHGGR